MVRGEERRWGGGGVAESWTLVECDVVRGGREVRVSVRGRVCEVWAVVRV